MIRLWVNAMTTSGDQTGDGPMDVSSANVQRVIDGCGTIRLECPADTRSRSLLRAGRYIQICYEDDDNRLVVLAEGIINNVGLNGQRLSVSAYDLFDELKHQITLTGLTLTGLTVQAAFSSLLASLDWTVEASGSALTTTVSETFTDSVSLLRALGTIADHSGTHFRLRAAGGRVVQVGDFGTSSGIVLFDPITGAGGDADSGLIESLTCEEQTDKLTNWILPVGANGFTMALSTNSAVKSMAGPSGTIYYVSDPDSIALYGLRQSYEPYTDIKTTGVQGANLIALAALTTLARRSTLRRNYRGKVRGLKTPLSPGDQVRVVYNEDIYQDDGSVWPGGAINENLYVIRADTYASDDIWQNVELSNINALREDEIADLAKAVERSKQVS